MPQTVVPAFSAWLEASERFVKFQTLPNFKIMLHNIYFPVCLTLDYFDINKAPQHIITNTLDTKEINKNGVNKR